MSLKKKNTAELYVNHWSESPPVLQVFTHGKYILSAAVKEPKRREKDGCPYLTVSWTASVWESIFIFHI